MARISESNEVNPLSLINVPNPPQNLRLSNFMEVSKMASRHWRNEDEGVRKNYKKIAKKLSTEYSEIQSNNLEYTFGEVMTPSNYI
nr:14702_t:CDS:2 [Entrophospora candida]